MSKVQIWGSIIGGVEILLRSIKTKKNFAPLAIVIEALSRVSQFLNNRTDEKK